jgi:thiol-disulfide isomerase/thioredoxin
VSKDKSVWIELVCMGLLACVFSACNTVGRRPAPESQNQSSPATSAEVLNNYGWTGELNQRVKLSDYRGKVVVLDFYATWCEPCRAETPHLVDLQRQYGEQGLQVIGLNVGGADDRNEVPGFAREFDIQYSLGFPDDEFADSLLSDNQNIPQAFIVDRGGRIVKRFVGYNDEMGRELERVVQASLTQSQ